MCYSLDPKGGGEMATVVILLQLWCKIRQRRRQSTPAWPDIEIKSGLIHSKIAQIIATAVLVNKLCFPKWPKKSPSIWATWEKIVINNVQKLPNLATHTLWSFTIYQNICIILHFYKHNSSQLGPIRYFITIYWRAPCLYGFSLDFGPVLTTVRCVRGWGGWDRLIPSFDYVYRIKGLTNKTPRWWVGRFLTSQGPRERIASEKINWISLSSYVPTYLPTYLGMYHLLLWLVLITNTRQHWLAYFVRGSITVWLASRVWLVWIQWLYLRWNYQQIYLFGPIQTSQTVGQLYFSVHTLCIAAWDFIFYSFFFLWVNRVWKSERYINLSLAQQKLLQIELRESKKLF